MHNVKKNWTNKKITQGLFLDVSAAFDKVDLDWSTQKNEVCLKANKKLSVLRGVKLLSRQTLDLLHKLTVRSVVDYGLPVYYNNLKLTELARLENLQYKAGKLVTGAYHYTSKDKGGNQ